VTGPSGYSVCMVDGGQNAGAGGVLGNFYNQSRVLDREGFQVWISG
jgi:hypothetical protein